MKQVLLLGLTIALFSSCSDEPESQKFGKLDAYTASQDFVKSKLISPSSAEFSDSYETSTEQLNDSTWYVNSFVDSQNGFGAMIRSKYVCKIVNPIGTSTAKCINVELLPKL